MLPETTAEIRDPVPAPPAPPASNAPRVTASVNNYGGGGGAETRRMPASSYRTTGQSRPSFRYQQPPPPPPVSSSNSNSRSASALSSSTPHLPPSNVVDNSDSASIISDLTLHSSLRLVRHQRPPGGTAIPEPACPSRPARMDPLIEAHDRSASPSPSVVSDLRAATAGRKKRRTPSSTRRVAPPALADDITVATDAASVISGARVVRSASPALDAIYGAPGPDDASVADITADLAASEAMATTTAVAPSAASRARVLRRLSSSAGRQRRRRGPPAIPAVASGGAGSVATNSIEHQRCAAEAIRAYLAPPDLDGGREEEEEEEDDDDEMEDSGCEEGSAEKDAHNKGENTEEENSEGEDLHPEPLGSCDKISGLHSFGRHSTVSSEVRGGTGGAQGSSGRGGRATLEPIIISVSTSGSNDSLFERLDGSTSPQEAKAEGSLPSMPIARLHSTPTVLARGGRTDGRTGGGCGGGYLEPSQSEDSATALGSLLTPPPSPQQSPRVGGGMQFFSNEWEGLESGDDLAKKVSARLSSSNEWDGVSSREDSEGNAEEKGESPAEDLDLNYSLSIGSNQVAKDGKAVPFSSPEAETTEMKDSTATSFPGTGDVSSFIPSEPSAFWTKVSIAAAEAVMNAPQVEDVNDKNTVMSAQAASKAVLQSTQGFSDMQTDDADWRRAAMDKFGTVAAQASLAVLSAGGTEVAASAATIAILRQRSALSAASRGDISVTSLSTPSSFSSGDVTGTTGALKILAAHRRNTRISALASAAALVAGPPVQDEKRQTVSEERNEEGAPHSGKPPGWKSLFDPPEGKAVYSATGARSSNRGSSSNSLHNENQKSPETGAAEEGDKRKAKCLDLPPPKPSDDQNPLSGVSDKQLLKVVSEPSVWKELLCDGAAIGGTAAAETQTPQDDARHDHEVAKDEALEPNEGEAETRAAEQAGMKEAEEGGEGEGSSDKEQEGKAAHANIESFAPLGGCMQGRPEEEEDIKGKPNGADEETEEQNGLDGSSKNAAADEQIQGKEEAEPEHLDAGGNKKLTGSLEKLVSSDKGNEVEVFNGRRESSETVIKNQGDLEWKEFLAKKTETGRYKELKGKPDRSELSGKVLSIQQRALSPSNEVEESWIGTSKSSIGEGSNRGEEQSEFTNEHYQDKVYGKSPLMETKEMQGPNVSSKSKKSENVDVPRSDNCNGTSGSQSTRFEGERTVAGNKYNGDHLEDQSGEKDANPADGGTNMGRKLPKRLLKVFTLKKKKERDVMKPDIEISVPENTSACLEDNISATQNTSLSGATNPDGTDKEERTHAVDQQNNDIISFLSSNEGASEEDLALENNEGASDEDLALDNNVAEAGTDIRICHEQEGGRQKCRKHEGKSMPSGEAKEERRDEAKEHLFCIDFDMGGCEMLDSMVEMLKSLLQKDDLDKHVQTRETKTINTTGQTEKAFVIDSATKILKKESTVLASVKKLSVAETEGEKYSDDTENDNNSAEQGSDDARVDETPQKDFTSKVHALHDGTKLDGGKSDGQQECIKQHEGMQAHLKLSAGHDIVDAPIVKNTKSSTSHEESKCDMQEVVPADVDEQSNPSSIEHSVQDKTQDRQRIYASHLRQKEKEVELSFPYNSHLSSRLKEVSTKENQSKGTVRNDDVMKDVSGTPTTPESSLTPKRKAKSMRSGFSAIKKIVGKRGRRKDVK